LQPVMSKDLRLFLFVGVVFGFLAATSFAQAPSKPDTKPDYSKEAFIVEQSSTKIVFETDGTGTRDSFGRIHVQSDAGVQRYGLLTFAYQNSTESVDIDYVKVQKADGSVVPTPPENTQDMATEITRQAPFYTDLREKHVAVKGLSVGDVLEFQVRWHSTKPLAPGQFWYAYNFSHDGIILRETLEVEVPKDRPIKWKSPVIKPVIAEEGAHRFFRWNTSHLEHETSGQEKADQELKLYQSARGQLPPPDIQISSFQNWEDVGRWYGDLQQERVKPTPEIRAKALDLTKGASDDNAKLRAIYKYVSTEFRYIGIAFGVGRYQPHTAVEVLANQYGDCKDKQTLLASLLDAVGIKAYPALINASHAIDLDLPSPGQFDHVIGIVSLPSGSVWLDTTPEVAPYAYLLSPLRGKHALVIPDDKPPALTMTPADPPTKALQTFKIDAKLSDTGTLEGKVEQTVQGNDSEVLLRSAFRRVPMPQWKDLIQQISYGSGFAGDVSEVTASSPEDLGQPFRFSYTYNRKDYPDWSNRRISSPLPPVLGQVSDTKPSHDILFGTPGEVNFESRVELPKGYSPEIPASVDLKENFGEYHASYAVKNGVLTTERQTFIKLQEVPLTEYDAFKKFAKAVSEDHERYVALSSGSAPANDLRSALAMTPNSDNDEAMEAFGRAMSQGQSGNMPEAVQSLNQAVKADPHFARAWIMLAGMYVRIGKPEMAVETLRKARDDNPHDFTINRTLVSTLMEQHEYEEAVSLLQSIVKSDPANSDFFAALGSALFVVKRYGEAADAVESAIKLSPEHAPLYFQLGSIYMHGGKQDKARDAFEKTVQLDCTPLMLNDVGYEMADANQNLPLSLDYAQRAVRAEEESTAQISLDELTEKDLQSVSVLAAYWDTLGWVYFRMGNLDKAERYLNAAWTISQSALIGDHLGQVYEQQHKKDQAVRMYRLALVASPRLNAMKDTESRLERLGGTVGHGRLDSSGREELGRLRTVHLSRITSEAATGEFFLLFVVGSKVQDVKFVSGSEKLKSADKALRAATFDVPLPDDGPTRLIRKGVLSCAPVSGCMFVLYTPDVVRSVH
jgi:tetratricopeptide (TPR) repeat protein/transglutaminase-like putative cysteine protease